MRLSDSWCRRGRREGGRELGKEGRRTSFLVIAHQVLADADLVEIHEVEQKGGREGGKEGRRTSFLVVAHQIFTDADLVGIHEVEHFPHFLLVTAFELVRHGEVFLEEKRERGGREGLSVCGVEDFPHFLPVAKFKLVRNGEILLEEERDEGGVSEMR